ncbi:hypothetical protein [Marinifilum caeruleilacunae]|jgi:hypothetical protein|uniref:Cytochrome c domain-containing protein n=1 Tax=Marinifilum caeruleilacunae TaxID=2499076 RepID=A0ABX1X0M1_9BACT|nr:hypothetical protein [Marinifilum caeruleilacunae]NOU61912.1 hypothetical protein [Marinifilum caeruleilacunae]
MQKSKFVHLITILATLLCFVSCEYDTIEFDEVVIPPDQEVTFSGDILPIFTAKCVECHDGSIKLDLREANAYNALINGGYIDTDNPSSSELYETVNGGHGSASQAEKQLILEWITRGANND